MGGWLRRESVKTWGWLLIAASIGAILGVFVITDLATVPDRFWWAVGTALALGVLLTGGHYTARLSFENSPALQIVFEPQDGDCIYRYVVNEQRTRGVWLWRSIVIVQIPAVTVRLRIVNIRRQPLKEVSVKLLDMRRLDAWPVRFHQTQLKWMHDDPPSVISTLGRPLAGGDTAYLDVAFKGLYQDVFNLSYATEHLAAGSLYTNGEYGLVLRATGRDDATGVSAPPCTQAFRLWVEHDGSLNLEPRTQQELGFTSEHV